MDSLDAVWWSFLVACESMLDQQRAVMGVREAGIMNRDGNLSRCRRLGVRSRLAAWHFVVRARARAGKTT